MNINALSSTAPLSKPNQFKYNGFEIQSEFGLDWYDYGARMYNPAIARWNGVDASAESYINESPYHYAGNNPVLFVDYDGNDYGISVDHETGKVTISGTFYTDEDSQETLDGLISSFTQLNGAYKYVFGEGEDQKEYDIVFDLTSEVVEGEGIGDPNSAGYVSPAAIAAMEDKSGEANSFTIFKEGTSSRGAYKNTSSQRTYGSSDGKNISAVDKYKDSNHSVHEIGHNLGLAHSKGLMGEPAGTGIFTSHISEILSGGNLGSSNRTRNATLGNVGTAARRPAIGSTSKGRSSPELNNGRVVKVKRKK